MSLIIGRSSCLNIIRSALAYWEFDETSGDAADSTGNGLTLIATGAPTSGAGIVGNCRVLNGTSQYFSIASGGATSLNPAGSFTLRLRIKGSGSMSNKELMGKDQSGAGLGGYILETNGTSPQLGVSSNGSAHTNLTYSGLTMVSGTWYDIFAGWDKAAGKLWMSVDAAPIQTVAFTAGAFACSSPFTVGVWGNLSTGKFPGSIDTAGIFGRKLSFREIRLLHQARSYPFR